MNRLPEAGVEALADRIIQDGGGWGGVGWVIYVSIVHRLPEAGVEALAETMVVSSPTA